MSVEDALTTFVAIIDVRRSVRNGYKETYAVKRCLLKKHEVMLKDFNKTFADLLRLSLLAEHGGIWLMQLFLCKSGNRKML